MIQGSLPELRLPSPAFELFPLDPVFPGLAKAQAAHAACGISDSQALLQTQSSDPLQLGHMLSIASAAILFCTLSGITTIQLLALRSKLQERSGQCK